MTQDEIENEARLLVEELRADRDPLNMAVATLTKLDDPAQFKAWMVALFDAAPGEQFAEFKVRITREGAFKAKNHLYHQVTVPQSPTTTKKPQVKAWNILRVSAWHLMPETRMDMISTGWLKQARVHLQHVYGLDTGWLLEMESDNVKRVKFRDTTPDLGPILRLADSLSCTHVLFGLHREMTQGLKAWHP